MTTFARAYLDETARIANALDSGAIERVATALADVRARGGRVFFLGVGGGAAHASHAVNDCRTLAGLEAYCPSDNAAELTARVNDDGWERSFVAWLKVSRLGPSDGVFVFSVGGGDLERNISPNIVRALEHAKGVGATIAGVVGRDGGFTARVADACVVVPTVNAEAVTPHTEGMQAVVWHLLVSHPALKMTTAKWESADRTLPRGAAPAVGIGDLRIKIFADGAELSEMVAVARSASIRGFTTNPTLMRKAGVTDYRQFAREVLSRIPDRPISFEVLSDDFDEMERQARCIATWGAHVYVKIPVTNTRGEPSFDLIRRLTRAGVQVNVTAVLTLGQVEQAVDALAGGAPSFISVFAGRIADTGLDPVPIMSRARTLLERSPGTELIWASPRELLNVFQADGVGCHIITLTTDILRKLDLVGSDLAAVSLATVRMFSDDAGRAGLTLEVRA